MILHEFLLLLFTDSEGLLITGILISPFTSGDDGKRRISSADGRGAATNLTAISHNRSNNNRREINIGANNSRWDRIFIQLLWRMELLNLLLLRMRPLHDSSQLMNSIEKTEADKNSRDEDQHSTEGTISRSLSRSTCSSSTSNSRSEQHC